MMTEAPERIWAKPLDTVNGIPSWIDEIEVSHPESYGGFDSTGTEYIRADIKPKVKPLEWRDCDGDTVSDSVFGTHAIVYDGEYGYTALLNDADDPYVAYVHPELGFETEEDAKNAISKGVERRVLGALEGYDV